MAERRKGRRSDDLDEAARCIEHIRIAAKHLKAAGIYELAHDLMERAEAMEREVGQAKKRRAKEQEDLEQKSRKTSAANSTSFNRSWKSLSVKASGFSGRPINFET